MIGQLPNLAEALEALDRTVRLCRAADVMLAEIVHSVEHHRAAADEIKGRARAARDT